MHSLYSESGLSVSLHIEFSPFFAECLQYLFTSGQYNLLFGISSSLILRITGEEH